MSLNKRFETMQETLERYNQAHLLSFYAELPEERQEKLLKQLEDQDWEALERLIKRYVLSEPDSLPEGDIKPAPYYPRDPKADDRKRYEEARARGETLLRAGKVALFTVAGGQGTRLGWDGPKGSFPATPIGRKPLFQVFAEMLLKAEKRYGVSIPWYIMTSLVNDQATRDFFAQHAYFGLEPENVMLFSQGVLPSIAFDGKLLLKAKDELAVNPDGHGGSFKALRRSGALQDMERRGIEHISYIQVDNPNVQALDPLFIGLHAQSGAQMSSKMLAKADPHERVGNFCLVDGRVSVIEYSDIPDELAEARMPDGELTFNAGSIAIHMIASDFVRRLTDGASLELPYHRAEKKVPYFDLGQETLIEPDRPNAVKLEMFIFDALPLAETSIILETDRVEEFAPIKNAEGTDSPATSRQLQSERAARWLEQQGVSIPRTETGELDAVIELSPLTATRAEDLTELDLPDKLEPGEEVRL